MTSQITTVGQWAAKQAALADLTAQYELFDSLNIDGTYAALLKQLEAQYMDEAKRGLVTAHPYRDYVIRTKAWAMARAMFSGKWSVEEYFRYRDYRGLISVNNLYRERFSQEQLQADFERGNDLELSQWMEAIVFFYGNRLLNIADDGQRPETSTDHWAWQRLVTLTHKLEEDRWFDEMFVVRSAINYCALTVSGVFLRAREERQDFLGKAGNLLWELNTVPTIANPSAPLCQ